MEHYQAQQLEKLLKMSIYTKQYIITKNVPNFIKSDVWSKFGFPAKIQNDGLHDVIPITAATRTESSVHQGAMDKYLLKKLLIQKSPNIRKTLEGQCVLFWFGHRLSNVLGKAFYQIKPAKDKELQASTTATTSKTRRIKAHGSSDEGNSSDDDEVYKKPSPFKQPEATTTFSSLPVKPKELLEMIFAFKSIVKYVKLTNINYEIKQSHVIALQQSSITRWISLSLLLQSIEASLEHVRSILSTKSNAEKQKLNINRINVKGLRDLAILLKTFEDVITLIQHGDRPTSTTTVTAQTFAELNKYLRMSIDDQYKISNPLFFWQHHQHKLPYLAKLARLLYSIPATSACVEQQFSAGDLLINERRSSLNPDTVQNVLFIRSIQKALKNNPNLFST
ncbi:unnamed protein product [Rotaria sp. Silwood2]|nr:unnamed protein product [Rotaria sp. Silwood2]